MKKKKLLALALVVALFVSNPAVALAVNPSQDTGSINGVTVTGNPTAYMASGSSSTYMATYCSNVTVTVDAVFEGYDMDTGNYFIRRSATGGVSSVLVIIDPTDKVCFTEFMKADHTASDGSNSWNGHTYARYF